MADLKPRDVVEDVVYGRRYAVTEVDGETLSLGLRDVATKTAYVNVPAADVVLVPGLRERT